MYTRHHDDLTIDRWRLEPRVHGLEFGEVDEPSQAPPLWKDLALASVVALVLWAVAAAVFG